MAIRCGSLSVRSKAKNRGKLIVVNGYLEPSDYCPLDQIRYPRTPSPSQHAFFASQRQLHQQLLIPVELHDEVGGRVGCIVLCRHAKHWSSANRERCFPSLSPVYAQNYSLTSFEVAIVVHVGVIKATVVLADWLGRRPRNILISYLQQSSCYYGPY